MTIQITSQPTIRATPSPTARSCPICGSGFPVDPRNPARTYCSHRCRNTAWRRRRTTTDAVTTDAVTTRGAGHGVRNADDTPAADPQTAHGAHGEVTTVQRCPHCRGPLVLVTLITTPVAAHVTVPDPPAPRRHQLRPL